MNIIENIKQTLGLSSPGTVVEPSETKKAIAGVKNKIKANVADSRHIREQIRAAKGIDRHNLWNDKRSVGAHTRDWLLAYGCLHGRLYASIEAKCAEGNEPWASDVLCCIQAFLDQEGPEAESWTKERVKAWLKRPESKEVPSKAEEAA